MQDTNAPSGARMTLARHILESQRQHPRARGELSVALLKLAFAGKIFSHAIHRAAFTGQLGATGERNVQGKRLRSWMCSRIWPRRWLAK
jgi:fructose-1,6-bisphosphatase